jgi:hypothetical protein
VQDGFTLTDLMQLLYGGYPIEVSCESCGKVSPVSLRERVELGELVAASCALPAKVDDYAALTRR